MNVECIVLKLVVAVVTLDFRQLSANKVNQLFIVLKLKNPEQNEKQSALVLNRKLDGPCLVNC